MKKYALLLLLFISASQADAQIKWEKLFSYKSSDVFRSVQEVNGGGYIMAGYKADSTANDTDAYVVRTNFSGDTLWTYTYNGPSSRKDLFYKILVTSTGDFIALGYTTSFSGGSDDFLYIKLNSSGQEQWVKSLGGSLKDRGQDIVETSDGFTICGYTQTNSTYYDAYAIHIDTNGDTLWTSRIGESGSNYDDANAIELLPDGGYILGGQSNDGANGLDLYLVRLNSDGAVIWTKQFGTPDEDNIESITLVSDGFVLAGGTSTTLAGSDGYIVKTDTAGNIIWSNVIGGSDQDDFHRIESTNDGGFILSGTTASFGPDLPNMWLVKTDQNGDTSWTKTFGGNNHDHGYSAIQTSDDEYIIVGHSGSYGFFNEEAYVVKTGPLSTNDPLIYITAYSILSPTCAEAASQVKVQIRNFGNKAISNIPVTMTVSGAVSATLTATHTPSLAPRDVATVTFPTTLNTSAGGSYTFEICTGIVNDVYPERNCSTTTTTFAPCTGIEEYEKSLGYLIYPNPASDEIVIDFSHQYKKADINIFSNTGQLVKTLIVNNTSGVKRMIDVSSFSKGIYLVKVNAEEGYDVRRIVVE